MTLYALLMNAAVAAAPGAPPLPYIERAVVETSLEALPTLVAHCVPVDAPAGLVRVAVWIERSGRFDVQSTTGAPDGGACWTAAIEGLAGPVHSGAPVEVAFGIPFATGVAGTVLDVELRVIPPDPLFMHVPAGLPITERTRLLEALGLADSVP